MKTTIYQNTDERNYVNFENLVFLKTRKPKKLT
jgi:hypothetical protein